ncbi:MAG: type II secretion system GspH family protein [bacterium]|nr:type II secretion system GspH family protein [bacterium]
MIELLVVIAIIGILASVVLASLNTARSKGSDAAIKADFAGLRASAEVAYDTNGNRYNVDGTTPFTADGDCGSGTGVANSMFITGSNIMLALSHAKAQNGGTALVCNQNAAGTAYAIATPLRSSGFWCIDSTGVARGATAAGTTYNGKLGASPAAITSGNSFCN